MKPTQRISKLFQDLHDGSPWLGVNFMDTLKNISAEQAAKKIRPERNSIWEILHHLVPWRLNVLSRIQGKTIVSPEHNYFLLISDTSEKAWEQTLQEVKTSQEKWIAFLKTFDERDFENIYPNNKMTYYEHIHSILQHDTYHLGQIVLLAKLT